MRHGTRRCATWTIAADVVEQVVLEAKYAGYIDRQAAQVERFQRLESRPIPHHFDYAAVPQLRAEAKEKLGRIRPASLGPGRPHQRHQPGRPGGAADLSGMSRQAIRARGRTGASACSCALDRTADDPRLRQWSNGRSGKARQSDTGKRRQRRDPASAAAGRRCVEYGNMLI